MLPKELLTILLPGVALSIIGALVVRRLVPREKLSENNDYVGFTFSMLSLIYGIYLAFTVVVVWQQFEAAEEKVVSEAVLMATIFRSVGVFPVEDRQRVQQDLIAYAREVIDKDYPRMERGMINTTNLQYEKLWNDFYAIKLPEDVQMETFYGEALTRLNDFAIARRERILASNATLPGSMWLLLIVGACGTIMFTWFYGTHYASIQIAATAFLSAVIIYGVMLVAMLENPFGGAVRVSDQPYREVLARFEELTRTK